MVNQKGFAHFLVLIILLLGIGVAVYLTQFTQIFKPKASENTNALKITSWEQRGQLAPNLQEFTYRGTAQSEMGAQYAAPGIPENMKALSSIIRYRDNSDSVRNYDLYLTPTLAIWKIIRYEADGQTSQYVGNFPSETCYDGQKTMTDGVIQPAIGLDGNYGKEGELPNVMVKTNYGCQREHYSVPYPIDNYQSAGSGRGIIPEITTQPFWDQTYQTLTSTSVSVPWVYYEGLLDKNSPQFKADFNSRYSKLDDIETAAKDSLKNISLNNQVTVLPDGTIQLTHMWNVLKKRPWMEHTTYSYWVPFDSLPSSKVIYFDKTTNQYVNPFTTNPAPIGFTTYGDLKIQNTGGWFGYFIDKHRPDFGIAFYTGFDLGMGGISLSPPYNPINPGGVPGIVTTHLFPKGYWDKIFYQTFLVIGTKEEMQQKSEVLNKYVYNFAIPDPTAPSPSPMSSVLLSPRPSASSPKKVGDLDNDNDVDTDDFKLFVKDFNDNNLRSDFNNSGEVDIFDFSIMIRNLSS